MAEILTKKLRSKPKFLQIAELIRKDISGAGEYVGENGRLTSIRDLSLVYKVTTSTVLQAIKQLADEDIVEMRERVGVFIKQPKPLSIVFACDEDIYSNSSTQYLTQLLNYLSKEATQQKCSFKFLTHFPDMSWDPFDQSIQRREFDGIIIKCQPMVNQRLKKIDSMGIKHVSIYPFSGVQNFVTLSLGEFTRQGVRELLRMGRRKIGLLEAEGAWPQEFIGLPNVESQYNFELAEAGVEVDQRLIRYPDLSEDAGYRLFCDILDSGVEIDSLVVSDELVARGAVRAAVERGLTDSSKLIIASQVTPLEHQPFALPVIEMRTPIELQARLLQKMLLDLIHGRDVQQSKIFLSANVYNPFE